MDNQDKEKKAYVTPQVTEDIELETRAGSPPCSDTPLDPGGKPPPCT